MRTFEHTQSLADFSHKVGETLDRLNQTGETEIITENGKVRAVLLSAAVYDAMAHELVLARDIATIQRSRQEIAEGKVQDVDTAFAEIRAQLLAQKAKRDAVE